MNEKNRIILYQDDNEITRVSVRFANEDLWLTQNLLLLNFENAGTYPQNVVKTNILLIVSCHIKVFKETRRNGVSITK